MPSRAQWLERLVVPNWNLKLAAAVLAVLTYYAIRGATSFEVSYEVPLEVKVEKGIAVLDKDARHVEVTFRGSQEDVRILDQKQIRAVIQAPGSETSGSREIAVHPRNIEGAPRVSVVRIRPGIVTVVFDHEAEQEVPVMKPRTLGKPLAGRAELDYDPKTVTIRGPARRLTEQQTVLTEPVDVDGRVESFVKRVRVISPSENWLTAIQPAEITVRVSIVAELASREFSDVPVLAVLPPGAVPSVRTTPERVRVTLRGRREELDSLAPEAVRVFVDLCGVETEGSYELPVNVHLPRGGDVSAGADPPTVRVAFGVK